MYNEYPYLGLQRDLAREWRREFRLITHRGYHVSHNHEWTIVINTTAAATIQPTMQYAATTAGNTITIRQMIVEVLD